MTTSVVVTGIGVVAPTGTTAAEFWAATLDRRHGIRGMADVVDARYPVALAGRVAGFDSRVGELPLRFLPQTDVSTRYALVAAAEALDDAAVDPTLRAEYRAGVVTANSSGGAAYIHDDFRRLWAQGPREVSVYGSIAWFYAVNTGQISILNGLRGAGGTVSAEQAGGLDALGDARRLVRAGTRLVVCGGVDSAFDSWGWLAHQTSGRASKANRPDRAFLPFDSAANGHVPGEGGAFLVLEDHREARDRGQAAYGEIAGYAATFDPRDGTGRPPGLRRAAELALDDAGLTARDVDAVFADAAGVPRFDAEEADVVRGMFGRNGVPVAVPKSGTGRLLSGGGPLDVVAALLTIRDQVLPPAVHTTDVPAEYGIDVVLGTPRPGRVDVALVLARGKGGFNSAVVVRGVG
ncbi:beta-ketoacyl synthase N-terminal-like domain-containing protein [Actinophytocola oryzae]|uniref:Act minimal PKS chain-length factor (CLF/KS beta) n=1 Tax=Actinophytocola oryzae TaxID=502181 RepID=A0A4R7US98_9PSEU|nr:beta-ketoacyl synthase N-terminal-like domain-containing protein [Actinophytocola oryzae]TDV38604.1 act minimal PKS chain-length factor (CLF/KS beta) [Actinophytocola oryzae]